MKQKDERIKSIWDAYQYLFYRIYIWQLYLFGKDDVPEFTALVGNSVLLGFNLLTLVTVYQVVAGHTFRIDYEYPILGVLLIYLVNYFLLIRGNKTQAIVDRFSSEGEGQRKRRLVYCLGYVVLTFLTFFISVALSPNARWW
ncbi:MAG: hypothetical protein IPM63_07325 [Acidobacteriota bacterium]|nr:MAG: hypothetical protein IPM63_07325 [Acidobacteriota bacterium]